VVLLCSASQLVDVWRLEEMVICNWVFLNKLFEGSFWQRRVTCAVCRRVVLHGFLSYWYAVGGENAGEVSL
jgi:hypothetical protein